MAKPRFDGSFQSANTPTYQNVGSLREDYCIYRCLVIKTIFTDDPANISQGGTNPEVLYDCAILGGFATGQVISNCRLLTSLGGNYNYYERILRSTNNKDLSSSRLENLDGDLVYVQFNQGNSGFPIIIGLSNGINTTSSNPGTKKSDGPRLVQQYNGVREEINNKGEFTFQRKGGTLDSDAANFNPNATAEYTYQVKENEVTVETFTSGLTITKDAKNQLVNINVNGTELIIDGKTGKITLSGAFVDLGASVTDLVTKFTALSSQFNMHSHQYINVASPAVTSPPLAPLLVTTGSQTVKVAD
jgi:hypothetical protein